MTYSHIGDWMVEMAMWVGWPDV